MNVLPLPLALGGGRGEVLEVGFKEIGLDSNSSLFGFCASLFVVVAPFDSPMDKCKTEEYKVFLTVFFFLSLASPFFSTLFLSLLIFLNHNLPSTPLSLPPSNLSIQAVLRDAVQHCR